MSPEAAAPQTPYEPPKQSVRGQLLDAATVLVLIFATLFATTYLTVSESEDATSAPTRQLSEMPLTPAERSQYQKMIDSGTADLDTISAGVAANQAGADKYEINVAALLGTAALLALYVGFVYRTSFREYREVIEEKFGPGPGRNS